MKRQIAKSTLDMKDKIISFTYVSYNEMNEPLRDINFLICNKSVKGKLSRDNAILCSPIRDTYAIEESTQPGCYIQNDLRKLYEHGNYMRRYERFW